jgi:hypothetical protein
MARRAHFPRFIALAVSGAAVVSGLAVGSPASAGPAAAARSVKAQIAAAQRQLTALDNQAEIATEHYNAARIKLQAAQTTAAGAQSRLTTAQHKLSRLQASETAFAVAAYRGSTTTSFMTLADGSTAQFLGRVSSMQAVSASEAETLVGVAAAKRTEEQAQADSTAALAVQRTATAAMAADRNQIVAAAATENGIIGKLQVKEQALIKAAKAAAARRAA